MSSEPTDGTDATHTPDPGHGFDPAARFGAREERGLRRDLAPTDRVMARSRFATAPGGDTPEFGDEKRVFAAADYLGLADHPRDALAAAPAEVGL